MIGLGCESRRAREVTGGDDGRLCSVLRSNGGRERRLYGEARHGSDPVRDEL